MDETLFESSYSTTYTGEFMYGTVRDVIDRLSGLNQDAQIGAIFWDADDVKEIIASYRNEKIDDRLASDALRSVMNHHDRSRGIDVDTIVYTVDLLKDERAQS
ncbi:hypothetical protein ACI0X9_003361 [Cronobacter turicensis]